MKATLSAADALLWARGGKLICSCGRPLLPAFGPDGTRIGVTHTAEDDDHHLGLWSSVAVTEALEAG